MAKDERKFTGRKSGDNYWHFNWCATLNYHPKLNLWNVSLWVLTPPNQLNGWRHIELPAGTTKRQAFAAARNFLRLRMDTGP